MPTMSKRALAMVLAAILLAAIGIIVYQQHVISTQKQLLQSNGKELARLQSRVRNEAAAQPPKVAPQSLQVQSGEEKSRRMWPDGRAGDLAFKTAELERTQRDLAASRALVDQLNAQVRTMQVDQSRVLAEANQQAGAMDARWKESLDNANLTLEGVRSDLRAAKQEMAQLQADNQALKEANASASGAGAETLRLLAQYQDLSRRREAYLNTILQRFRDVTRQYRSFAAIVGARRNDQPGPLIDEADFGRILNALTSAQDDLRQIETLNGQAQQIERKLAKK